MPINERGEFVRERSVGRTDDNTASPPRRSPPPERSGGGRIILVLLVLGMAGYFIWHTLANAPSSTSATAHTPEPLASHPPFASAPATSPSVQPQEERPTGVISAVGATVKGVQFFESGLGQVPKQSREYNRRFASRGTRYINWELDLVSPTHSSNMSMVIETVWHNPAGGVYARQSTPGDIHADWSDYWFTSGWGDANGTSFAPGTYRLDFFVNGGLIAREGVEVYDGDAPPAMYIQAIDAKIAHPLRFFASEGEVPAKDRRSYYGQFSRSRIWYINWELNLLFPAKGSRLNFTIHEVWTKPDGSVDHEADFAAYVDGGWVNSYHNNGWGRTGGGGWPGLGTYRVDLFVENRKIVSGTFEVVE